MVHASRWRAAALAGAVGLTACAGTAPAPTPVTASAARTSGTGAIAGNAALGAGRQATGVLDESYLFDQHEKARQQAPANAATGKVAPNPPWSSTP